MSDRSQEFRRGQLAERTVSLQHEGESIQVKPSRPRWLKNIQLNSIDNMRKDGKFVVAGDIPEGQGSVNDLLAECFDLSYELRVAAETEGDD